ncbi:hypothetical protein HFO68_32600 [Rhizobium laguerreae]|nr:hypothetical protein [Rhizobium bangladeshense]MBX5139270.1 hypothetical protein [Rhizobium lentis]MBY2941815.1 hypothetical protein [Rhizobium leguminosarum]MBY3075457.1 hypothetical protein [Rhizobium laguerreae]MBX4918088.1 hypothetical protein [Rhizobium bangladeshense]
MSAILGISLNTINYQSKTA